MAKTKTSKYDVAEHLRTPKEMAAYLEACLEEANDVMLVYPAKAFIKHSRENDLQVLIQ
jgi:DNA-binding phage protein